jgi:hypothetical protein
VQLACQERPRLVRVAVDELETVRPIDGERIDVEPLQRLEDRLPRAPVERDALLHFSRLRTVLQQHDVPERVPGAKDGHASARGGADLMRERVDLDDRLVAVLLVDLVGRHGTHGGRLKLLR